MARLQQFYKDQARPALVKKFGYKSVMQVPCITKITLNMGLGGAVADKKIIETSAVSLANIAGQKPLVTRARKAIAAFNKLREGVPIGLKVTLRGRRMWEFFDRLVTIALPRVRDFRGVSVRAFDGRGNYSLGVKDQSIFPEVEALLEHVRGMDINVVTSAKTDEEAKALLDCFKFPFRN